MKPETQLWDMWHDCERCFLYQTRRNVCIGRGHLPADILFIGEGPGKTEDAVGEPFKGESGHLLRMAVDHAKASARADPVTEYYTNIVGCRPCHATSGPNREPTAEEAMACRPRLEKILQLAQPKRVILLGKVAKKYSNKLVNSPIILWHPAYILRRGGLKSPEYTIFVKELEDVYRSLYAAN